MCFLLLHCGRGLHPFYLSATGLFPLQKAAPVVFSPSPFTPHSPHAPFASCILSLPCLCRFMQLSCSQWAWGAALIASAWRPMLPPPPAFPWLSPVEYCEACNFNFNSNSWPLTWLVFELLMRWTFRMLVLLSYIAWWFFFYLLQDQRLCPRSGGQSEWQSQFHSPPFLSIPKVLENPVSHSDIWQDPGIWNRGHLIMGPIDSKFFLFKVLRERINQIGN